MGEVEVKAAGREDGEWLAEVWRESWGDEIVVSRGRVFRLRELPTLVAWVGGQRVGAATYRVEGDAAELTSLNAMVAGQGVGSALLRAVERVVRAAGVRRLWLITTNDNVDALRFYQRRGFRLVRLHAGAVDGARRLKPAIPAIGEYGIPIRDELELEKALDPGRRVSSSAGLVEGEKNRADGASADDPLAGGASRDR
jgi:N-acetylglutamate synthase-like GNAT family acetyltransferase